LDIEKAKQLIEQPDPVIAEQWLCFLSEEQVGLEEEIVKAIMASPKFRVHIIFGGPGTGKTQVLLLLAQELEENGFEVGYFTTSGVRTMIKKAGLDIPDENSKKGAIHLVDDPIEIGNLNDAIKRAIATQARAIVLAIDPFQWTERNAFLKLAGYFDERKFLFALDSVNHGQNFQKATEYGTGIDRYYLRTSYRQKQTTGENAVKLSKDIFTQMNPYIHEHKQEAFRMLAKPYVDNILEGTTHNQAGGAFQTTISDDGLAIWEEVSRIASRQDRWTWSESALFVYDSDQLQMKWNEFEVSIPGITDSIDFDKSSSLEAILRILNFRLVKYSTSQLVRGQEFQDVVVSVSNRLWSVFHKRKIGMSGDSWKAILPIHTFTTRAIDSVHIIVGF